MSGQLVEAKQRCCQEVRPPLAEFHSRAIHSSIDPGSESPGA